MALSSMTGFARGHGVAGSYAWSWEIKSVNAKGLDLRLRLPPGWDAVEVPARKNATEKLSRGTVYANLTVERKGVAPTVKVNEPVLAAVLATLKSLAGKVEAAPPTLDGILALKGVIEVTEEDEREEDRRAAEAAIIAGFDRLLADLIAMRREEGATLGRLLSARLDEIAALAARARSRPRPQAGSDQGAAGRAGGDAAVGLAAFRQRPPASGGDPDRQPRPISARSSTGSPPMSRRCAKMIADGGPIGRRLDFLAQELNRESNTLTAKANDVELTNIGLELKSVVEQFREQVQNLE